MLICISLYAFMHIHCKSVYIFLSCNCVIGDLNKITTACCDEIGTCAIGHYFKQQAQMILPENCFKNVGHECLHLSYSSKNNNYPCCTKYFNDSQKYFYLYIIVSKQRKKVCSNSKHLKMVTYFQTKQVQYGSQTVLSVPKSCRGNYCSSIICNYNITVSG